MVVGIRSKIFEKFDKFMVKRGRKKIIFDRDGTSEYMIRYYLWRKSDPENNKRGSNLFLHKIIRSDSDNHLHDHPWDWATFLIKGSYIEILPTANFLKPEHADEGELDVLGNVKHTYYMIRNRFTMRKKSANDYHQIKLVDDRPVWSIFWHGKRTQDWGFFVNGEKVYWKTYLQERLKNG